MPEAVMWKSRRGHQRSIPTYLAVKAMVSFMRFLYTECVFAERRRSAKVGVAERTVVVPWKNTASLWNITMAIISLGTAPLWLIITSLCGAAG